MPRSTLNCPVCDKAYSRDEILNHMRRKHPKELHGTVANAYKKVACEKCGKKLKQYELSAHYSECNQWKVAPSKKKTRKQRLNELFYPDGLDEHESRWRKLSQGGGPGLGKKK